MSSKHKRQRKRDAPGSGRKRGRHPSGPTASGRRDDGPKPLQLTELNWLLLGLAVIVIAAGFVALDSSVPAISVVLAPVLLVVGYCVLAPLGLIL